MNLRLVAFLAMVLIVSAGSAEARWWRNGMVPYSPASCNTCHTTGGGTPRNEFGLAVEAVVTANGREVFWGPALAAMDSDGDGVTNGEELGDPDGIWVSGDTPAGHSALVSLPGTAGSTPPHLSQVASLAVQLDVAEAGLTFAVSRSVSGRMLDFSWSGSTSDEGLVTVNIKSDKRAGGYYVARLTNASDEIVGEWGSIPVRSGRIVELDLPTGGRASVNGYTAISGGMSASKLVASPSIVEPGSLLSSDAALGAGAVGRDVATHTLHQNAPNPFNPTTQIRYELPEAGDVRLAVYNNLGQEVARLVDARQTAGPYSVKWNANGMASGVYYYVMEVGSVKQTRRMLLLK
jgi:hypothetical protein